MAYETGVILKSILLSLKKCESLEEAVGVVENLLSKEEIAAVNEKLAELKRIKDKS